MTLYSFIRSQAEQQQLVSPVPGDSVARHDTGNIQGQAVGIMKGSSGLAILHRARNEAPTPLKFLAEVWLRQSRRDKLHIQ